jgi:hypothetical protein
MKKENNIRDRFMKEVSQENVQKTDKDSKEVEKRSHFVFDKEKIKIIKKIKKIKKVQKIASLSARKKISNKLRIIDI